MRILNGLAVALAAVCAAPTFAMAAQAEAAEVADSEVDKALQALAEVDAERLLADKAYAGKMLVHLDALRGSSVYAGEARVEIDRLRMFTLMGAGKDDAALIEARQLTRLAPGDPELHYFALLLGVETNSPTTLEELQFANRSLRAGDSRLQFRDALDEELVSYFRRPFYAAKDKDKIARSAQLLLDFDWPGAEKLDMADSLRLEAAEGLLAKGEVAAARQLVFTLRGAGPVLKTLVVRKWDGLREAGDPAERLAQAVAASDEASGRAFVSKPSDPEILLARAAFLRSVGKEADALEILLPRARDVQWVTKHGEDGFWVVNEAAYALVALSRAQEAVTLMEGLLSRGLRQNPLLISMAINNISILMDSGDYGRAAAYATELATTHHDLASPYGRMWMWQGAVCGHAFAGDLKAAQPWLAKLKSGEKDNPAALTRALLCVDDEDAVAASINRRLADDPEDLLVALQDYSAGPQLPPVKAALEERLKRVLARPDVQSALAQKGRIMKVPLSRTYWGLF